MIKKTPLVNEEWKPKYRKIYVWATRYGILFAAMLGTMLIGAINYNNSMAFAITFLLAGMGCISLYKSHSNIEPLTINLRKKKNTFLNEEATFVLTLKNKSSKKIYSIEALWHPDHAFFDKNKNGDEIKIVDIEPEGEAQIELGLKPDKRGYLSAPWIIIQTHFPLGLCRVWTWVRFDCETLIYPKPKNITTQGANFEDENDNGKKINKSGNDEFSNLRNYVKGDTLKSIDWKAFAKYNKPLVKQFIDIKGSEIWFSWHNLPQYMSIEEKLSALTYHIVIANKQNMSYGLIMPNKKITPNNTQQHYQHCLKTLALY